MNNHFMHITCRIHAVKVNRMIHFIQNLLDIGYISSIHFGFILQEIGKHELINGPFIMTPVLSDSKALSLDKLIITTSKVGNMELGTV